MNRLVLTAAILGGFAVAVSPGTARAQAAVACVNCTNEMLEIVREAKRAAGVLKQIAVAKEQVMHEYRTWEALYNVKNFDSMIRAMGGVTNTYYPEANAIPDVLRTGKNLSGGGRGLDLDRLISRGTVSQIMTATNRAEGFFENMEHRQRIVALGRQTSADAMQSSSASIRALGAAQRNLSASRGSAEIQAAQGALIMAGTNAQLNQTRFLAVRAMIEDERHAAENRREERDRMAAVQAARETEWAVRRLGSVR